jgi:hypothetical protein
MGMSNIPYFPDLGSCASIISALCHHRRINRSRSKEPHSEHLDSNPQLATRHYLPKPRMVLFAFLGLELSLSSSRVVQRKCDSTSSLDVMGEGDVGVERELVCAPAATLDIEDASVDVDDEEYREVTRWC